jgi:hypothetical protein
MYLDSSGNLGIGVTPNTWISYRKAVQVNTTVALSGGSAYYPYSGYLTNNAYWDSTDTPKYIASSGAAAFAFSAHTSGNFAWFTAPSGTAGNAISFTQILALDTSGNMSLNGSNYNTASSTGITIADHGNNYDLGSLQGYIKFVGRYWSGDDNIGGAGAMIGAQKGAGNGYTGTQLAFYTTEQGASSPNQNSQKMVLTGNGRLGIGTNSPNARLEVYPGTITGSSSQEILRLDIPGNDIFSTATGYINFRGYDLSNSTQRDVAYIGVELVANPNSSPYMGGIIKFNTCASGASTSVIERARITSGGYFKASNNGTYTGSTGAYHELYNTATADWIAYFTQATATSPNGVVIQYTAAAPNGLGNTFLYCVDNAAVRATIRSNGGLANYSANNVNLSDRREKTNFAPAKSYLNTICAIPVQTFNYIDQSEDDPGLTLGVVAQDVQAVAPELVTESNWGTEDNPKMRLSIYQTDLQYALMKCIQEQQAMINELKADLELLKNSST